MIRVNRVTSCDLFKPTLNRGIVNRRDSKFPVYIRRMEDFNLKFELEAN